MSARSLEAHLHEPRRFTQLACGGYPPLSLSLPTLQSALRLHLLPEPYLPRGDTPLRRRGLSHVCPFVGACDSGGLCHRAVLCRYQQCRDGPRKPRPLTRLLDRGQSTESLALFIGDQPTDTPPGGSTTRRSTPTRKPFAARSAPSASTTPAGSTSTTNSTACLSSPTDRTRNRAPRSAHSVAGSRRSRTGRGTRNALRFRTT